MYEHKYIALSFFVWYIAIVNDYILVVGPKLYIYPFDWPFGILLRLFY